MKKTKIVSAVAAAVLLSSVASAHGHRYGKKNNNGTKQSQQQTKSHKGQRMNKHIRNGLVAASATMVMSGCNSTDGNNSNTNNSGNTPDIDTSSYSTLSQDLVNTLSYMGNEERLAYDVYNALYAEWGTKQFTNIASKSEVKHIQAVQDLIKKYKINDDVNFTNVDLEPLGYMNTAVVQMQAGTYDISKIQRLYDDLVSEGSASEVAALQVACKVEVIDVEDLDAYIKIAEDSNAQDVVDTFNFLRKGSYNHYWAFDGALKNIGVSDGCCSLGTAYCHPEYPQNEKGNGR